MILVWTLVAGCTRTKQDLQVKPDLFWPKPPDARRIQFVNQVSKPKDLNIEPGYLKRFVNYMAGVATAPIVCPYGISSDSNGSLYVVDTVLKQIHVFDEKQNTYFCFPQDRSDPEPKLVLPVCIAVDRQGFIYVTDAKQGDVDIFKDQGKTYVASLGQGILKRPTGIAVNQTTSELLVVDTVQSRVFRYDLATHTQKGWFGGDGLKDGQLHYPTHIFVTRKGLIVVSDSLNFRVQVFSPEGRFLSKFGRMGQRPGAFARPKGVACDSDGNIYVVDALFDNVQVFNPQGRLLMAFGDHGSGSGQFWLPSGIYIDANDYIYVSDTSNKRVSVFKYLKEGVLQ